jgi:hypothetical protein
MNRIEEPKIAGYCIVRNAEILSYPFYDAVYQCFDNVDEFHLFYDTGSDDLTVPLTEKFVNVMQKYFPVEMHPIGVNWKDQSAISEAQNLGAKYLRERGFEYVLLNQADEFLPVGMKSFLKECYRNKQQVGFNVIHTWKDEYIITTAPYCRFYRSDTQFKGDGANVCGSEVKDFVMHNESVHHFGTLFHPQQKYSSHSKLYGSKEQEYIAANVNDIEKVQEGFRRLIGTGKFFKRDFPLREREDITVRYSREYESYPFELALKEITDGCERKRLQTVERPQQTSGHLLSFIIPCYNCAGTVVEAVESIYHQNLDIPFEVICTDDCSTDSTRDILAYAKRVFQILTYIIMTATRGGPLQEIPASRIREGT